MSRWRRAVTDVVGLRDIDAYVVVVVAVVLAVLTVVDVLPDGPDGDKFRWTIALAALAVLVFRSVSPPARSTFGTVAEDRVGFDAKPLAARWASARTVSVFAPSAVNLISGANADLLRKNVLALKDSVVRVVVLDPTGVDAVRVATEHLDGGVDVQIQRFGPSLEQTLEQLRLMSGWSVAGTFEYRVLGFNPGFSLMVTDGARNCGSVVVEFHGFHHEATAARMHLELTRDVDERWFAYWTEQFDHI